MFHLKAAILLNCPNPSTWRHNKAPLTLMKIIASYMGIHPPSSDNPLIPSDRFSHYNHHHPPTAMCLLPTWAHGGRMEQYRMVYIHDDDVIDKIEIRKHYY